MLLGRETVMKAKNKTKIWEFCYLNSLCKYDFYLCSSLSDDFKSCLISNVSGHHLASLIGTSIWRLHTKLYKLDKTCTRLEMIPDPK